MYELIKRDGMAKRGRLTTVHGTIETPVFMNVGTAAAIKGLYFLIISIAPLISFSSNPSTSILINVGLILYFPHILSSVSA